MAGGAIFGTLFYVGFFIAAFSSGIAGWEAVIAFLMDTFNFSRMKAMIGTFLLVMIIAIPATLSDDMFNLFDMIVNNVFLTVGCFIMCIFIGWIWGMENVAKTCGLDTNSGIYKFLCVIVKYLAPIIIIALSLSLFGII